jgi:O-antigen/teichoic acid export membrane protein
LAGNKVIKGALSNICRVGLSAFVALIVPPIFTSHLSPAEYGAWILILQCSSYVAYLDLGLQTTIGKHIAEHHAAQNLRASSRILTNAFFMLVVSAILGILLILGAYTFAGTIFRQTPAQLLPLLRMGILVVGLSATFGLPFNAFLAVFNGLQRYTFPTVVMMANKTLTSAVYVVILLLHGDLRFLIPAIALLNLINAATIFIGWHLWARQEAPLDRHLIAPDTILYLIRFCGILTIWTMATLLISGMDLFIVGHYDFASTAYYGIAVSATNFMIIILTSLFGPLLPAISALKVSSPPEEVAALVLRASRYCSLAIVLIAMPLLIGAQALLTMWVGPTYALKSHLILQILVLGNAVRMICYPYSLSVIATGTQRLATLSSITEAIVNFSLSIFLVQRIGAVGVAYGTLIGAFVGIAVHFFLSMRLTRRAIPLSFFSFLNTGLKRPLLVAALVSLSIPLLDRLPLPSRAIPFLVLVPLLPLLWFVGMKQQDRHQLVSLCSKIRHKLLSSPLPLEKRSAD